MAELADVFRVHGPAYRETFKGRIPRVHLEAMAAIELCRTEAMGGHVYWCTECREYEYSYHSCKNRNCPKCRNEGASQWLETQQRSLLPVPYFMVTFTLPQELRGLARSKQRLLYGMMFRASAAALKDLARDPKHLGGLVGMVGVLQTWNRELVHHPHIHYLVPGGALSPDGSRWLEPRYKNWLVPEKALAKLFRGKMKALLQKAGLKDKVPRRIWKKKWTVDCAPVGTGAEAFKYLAPYIHRIAITNKRIKKLEKGQVTFQVKNRTSKKWEDRTLPAEEFIRRYLQHVLPKGFQKVRYYGFLHPHHKQQLRIIKELLGTKTSDDSSVRDFEEDAHEHTSEADKRLKRCRKCGAPLVHVRRLRRTIRSPPVLEK